MAARDRGKRVNRAELADTFGVSLPTVDGWVRAGCPVVERGGRGKQWVFNTAAIAEWLRDRAVEDATGSERADEAEWRARKLRAQALHEELELAKKRGEVAPVEDFRRATTRLMTLVRVNMLNVPDRVVMQIVGETDEARIKRVLRDEIVAALTNAAQTQLEPEDFEDDEIDDEADDGGE